MRARVKRSSYVFVTIGVFEVCLHCILRHVEKRHSLIWKGERARLSRDRTRTFDPAVQKGESSGSSLG